MDRSRELQSTCGSNNDPWCWSIWHGGCRHLAASHLVPMHAILFRYTDARIGGASRLGPFLLTWFNFNPSMDKETHPLWFMRWNYLSIHKLQRCNRWSLGLKKWFHPTLYNGCDYLFMPGLKLIHVSKRSSRLPMFVPVPGLLSRIAIQGPLLLTWFNFNPTMDK